MTAARSTQAAITRALTAAVAAGLIVARFSVARDGTVTVETESPKPIDTARRDVRPMPKEWSRG
jgi:hypothetical protein